MALVVLGMQIDGGGVDRCVAQIALYVPQVVAGVGLVRRGGVAQPVRGRATQEGCSRRLCGVQLVRNAREGALDDQVDRRRRERAIASA